MLYYDQTDVSDGMNHVNKSHKCILLVIIIALLKNV